jgi:hypothetical protein
MLLAVVLVDMMVEVVVLMPMVVSVVVVHQV